MIKSLATRLSEAIRTETKLIEMIALLTKREQEKVIEFIEKLKENS